MHDGDQEEPKQKPKVKKLTYQDDMNQLLEFNKFCLESYGYITGAVELSAVKWGVLSLGVKSLFSVGTKNLIPEGKLGNHLFKSVRDGLKLSDNPANRNLITKLSNGKSLGTDAFGKSWYAKNFYGPEGNVMQIFSYTQNGIIKGAGINSTPINLIKTYGLK